MKRKEKRDVFPRAYLDAIDREVSALKKDLDFAKRHGALDVVPRYEAEIAGLEMAKNIIQRTYYAYQEPLYEKARTEAEAGVRGRGLLSLDHCRTA